MILIITGMYEYSYNVHVAARVHELSQKLRTTPQPQMDLVNRHKQLRTGRDRWNERTDTARAHY